MDRTITIRPAQTIPQHLIDTSTISIEFSHQVFIRHPGYPSPLNLLLVFEAQDHAEGGIHHETARIACGIVAGNIWNGYFTEDLDGPPVMVPPYGILLNAEYYFHVPAPISDTKAACVEHFKYPVVPCFKEWRFPHKNLPPPWNHGSVTSATRPSDFERGNASTAVLLRDVSCRVSDHQVGCEKAHLCPRSEARWFLDNGMQSYRKDHSKPVHSAINNPANVMLMREDLHTAFDQRQFVFVPKVTRKEASVLVSHVLKHSPELSKLYHNTKLHSIDGIASEFLFTRFAWSVFPLLQNFLVGGVSKNLLLSTGECRVLSSDECNSYLEQSETRSQSGTPSAKSSSDTALDSSEEGDCGKKIIPRKRVRCVSSSPSASST